MSPSFTRRLVRVTLFILILLVGLVVDDANTYSFFTLFAFYQDLKAEELL